MSMPRVVDVWHGFSLFYSILRYGLPQCNEASNIITKHMQMCLIMFKFYIGCFHLELKNVSQHFLLHDTESMNMARSYNSGMVFLFLF